MGFDDGTTYQECDFCGGRMILFDGDALAVILYELSRQKKDGHPVDSKYRPSKDYEAISFWTNTAIKVNVPVNELAALWKPRLVCLNFDCIPEHLENWGCKD